MQIKMELNPKVSGFKRLLAERGGRFNDEAY
jgi:hypothetical protein